MMNVPGVLGNDPDVRAKLDAARQRGLPIDGHAPGLCGDAICVYAAAGITTDHESLTFEEAREKLKAGIKLQVRYGSAARRFEPFLPLLPRFPELCMFCSDDKHPDDLLRDHINFIAATAFRQGLALQTILQAACVNPVRHYRLPLGLLQPGDSADFQIVDDLRTFRPREVWLRGRCVARDGVSLLPAGEPREVDVGRGLARPRDRAGLGGPQPATISRSCAGSTTSRGASTRSRALRCRRPLRLPWNVPRC